eukprot:scaffold3431_cov307-Prasinococcus_capsulatus_cf.AAC.4
MVWPLAAGRARPRTAAACPRGATRRDGGRLHAPARPLIYLLGGRAGRCGAQVRRGGGGRVECGRGGERRLGTGAAILRRRLRAQDDAP